MKNIIGILRMGRAGLAAALVALAVLGAGAPASSGSFPGTIGVEEIEPGMKGHGLSVFRGREPVRFEVEVVDVIPNAMTRQDLILVMCSGQGLEKSKLVAGMSGSPIYIEGRLAGALAYGWAFSQDPLTGVTPIKYMIEAMNQKNPAEVAAAPPAFPATDYYSGPAGREIFGQWFPGREDPFGPDEDFIMGEGRLRDDPPGPASLAREDGGPMNASRMAPIATPLLVSGFSPRSLDFIKSELGAYNLVPVAAGGLSSMELDPAAIDGIIPGSAVGAALVSGDLSMTAIGTLTHRDGDRVVAFGHPFLGAGPLSMPLVSARIHTVVNSQSVSFKLGTPVAAVGALISDVQPGIVGVLGREAETVPMKILIDREATGLRDQYNLDLAKDRTLTPLLVRISLLQVIMAAAPSLEPTTVRAHTKMRLEKYGEVEYEDVYAIMRGNFSPGYMDPVMFFAMNPFEELEIEELEVAIEIKDELKVAAIKSVRVNTDEAEPGGEAEVVVVLRPFNEAPAEYSFKVRVPDDEKIKSLRMMVIGGARATPDAALPDDVEGMIGFMNSVYPANHLVLTYQVPGQGVDLKGQRLKSLPPSVSSVLQPQNAQDARGAPELVYMSQKTPYVIVGRQKFSMNIKHSNNKSGR